MGWFESPPQRPADTAALVALQAEVAALRGQLEERNAQWDILLQYVSEMHEIFVTMAGKVRQQEDDNRVAAERQRPMIVLAPPHYGDSH